MARSLVSPSGSITLRPVYPNPGIQAAYRKRLMRLVDEMQASLVYWISAAYKANPPVMAQDDTSPALTLRQVVRRLSRRWQKRFNDTAPKLADYFATAVKDRSDTTLKMILKEGGFSVGFTMTARARDAYQAVIGENVALIKSIASEHLSEVEGLVMRSVSQGRNLGGLAKELEVRYGVTKRRAALIARDQNNKATAVINKVRQAELGITEAIWMHSGGGKHPRPTHVAMNGKRYKIEQGMHDPAVGNYVQPGELINCRCVSRPVIPGL